ncbi:MAG: PAS domain S-box protein [Methanosarcina sp.]
MQSNSNTGVDQVGELKKQIEILRQELDQRIRSEEILLENEEKFSAAFGSNPNALVLSYQEDGRILDVNESFLQLFATTKDDVIGKTSIEFNMYTKPSDRDRLLHLLRTEGYVKNMEILINRRTGESRTTLLSAVTLTIQKKKALLGTLQDISDRKTIQDALLKSQEQYRHLVESANSIIIRWGTDGNLRFVNSYALEYFGYSRDELIGQNVMMLVPKTDSLGSDLAGLAHDILANPMKYEQFENENLRKNGEHVWVSWTNRAITDDKGKILEILAIGNDITQRKKAENDLKIEHDILDAVIRNIGTGFVVADNCGNIISLNASAMRIHDFVSEEDKLTKLQAYIEYFRLEYPEGGEITPDKWPLALAIRGAFFKDYKVKLINRKNNRVRYISYNTVPIYDNSSRLTFIIITMSDYTEINERTSALAHERELLAGIFDNIPVMITIYDPDMNNFRFNKELRNVLGWNEEDASEGDLMSKIYPDPAYRKEVIEYMQLLTPGWKELSARAKDGTVVDSSWANITLSNGVQIGIGIDIRATKKAEEDLRKNEQRLQGIFNNVAIGIIEVDADDNIISVNDRTCEILGYEPDEIIGKTIASITAPDDRDLTIGMNRRLHYGEFSIFDYEKRYIKKDGSSLWVHVTVSAVKNSDGEHINSIGTVEDISERRKAIEALRESEEKFRSQNEELTRFIYTVSHDLKSPLVTIKSFTSYLKEDIDGNDKEAQDKDIKYIQNAADKMGKLLDELLELSRIGRKEKPKTRVLVEHVVQSAVDLVAGRLEEKNINVRISGPSIMLYGHEQRFVQLYQNLIDNAAKFIGDQPEPIIEAGSYMDEKKQVVLFVKDNGSGIDPRHHHKIFGLFEKMDNKTEGTGIGLALVKRIVEVHGGAIWFTSEGTGKGTTFFFRLQGAHIIE